MNITFKESRFDLLYFCVCFTAGPEVAIRETGDKHVAVWLAAK